MKVTAYLTGVLISLATLTGCASKPEVDDACLDNGINFELSKDLMSAEDEAKTVAAMHMALAQLGFTQSPEVVNHFDPVAPIPAVRYIHLYDQENFKYENGTRVPSGPWVLTLGIYGACGNEAASEKKKYADSIKEKIETALQPYATEKVVTTDATFIEVD